MIDVNSNCSRVDAVKAQATQMKLQSSTLLPAGQAGQADETSRKVKSDFQTLDTQIKTGDAKKAELALAAAKKDLAEEQTQPPSRRNSQNSGSLDAYA